MSEIVTDWVYADRLKPNGAIVSEWTTEAITRITGFRPDEVHARGSWLDLVYADDHPILHERTQALLSGKSQVSEYRIIAKSGEIRWLRDHAHPVWGQVQGRVVGVYGAVQDITERKRAEEEIAGLAKFPSENPNSVLRVAKDGIILYANKASLPLLDVWGCQVCQPLPDDWRKFTADVFSSGASKHTEVEYQDHILSLTFSSVVDTGYVNVYGLDITERKQAEEALRESEEKFGMISASAQDAIIMMDSEGNISFWNEAAQKIFGYSSQEALGKGLHLLLAPERYHEAYRKGFGRFKTTGQGAAVGKTLELEAVRKDGTEFPAALSLSAVKLGGKWNAIGIMRDITERKRAEEALRISEERFALAVQGSNDGIWDWDIQNNSLYWSPRLKELLGYADDELDVDFDTFDSHLHPDDRERMGAAIEAHLKDRGLYDVEQRLRTKSGQYRWFRARGQHFGTRPEIPFA